MFLTCFYGVSQTFPDHTPNSFMFVAINVPVVNSSTTFALSDQFKVFLTKIYLVAVESSPLPPEEPSQVERVEVENEGIDETPPQIQKKRNRKTCTFPVKSKRLTRQSKAAVKLHSHPPPQLQMAEMITLELSHPPKMWME
jgi:hypothetical protein